MGKLIVTEFVSIDGVFEDPGGSENYEHGGWTFEYDRGDDGNKFKLDELMDAEVQLLGRVTYEGFAAAWPAIDDEAGFGARMNGMPKYVVSRTLTEASWNNTTILPGDPVDEVRRLREARGGDLLVAGSATGSMPGGTSAGSRTTAARRRSPASAGSSRSRFSTYDSSPVRWRPRTSASMTTSGVLTPPPAGTRRRSSARCAPR